MDEKRRKIRNKYTQLLLKSKKISEGYESSWSTHCRMFGDLLEPAFADDEASRLELVGALNLISRGKYTAAAKKLDRLLDGSGKFWNMPQRRGFCGGKFLHGCVLG